jgi:hypothetical protein
VRIAHLNETGALEKVRDAHPIKTKTGEFGHPKRCGQAGAKAALLRVNLGILTNSLKINYLYFCWG